MIHSGVPRMINWSGGAGFEPPFSGGTISGFTRCFTIRLPPQALLYYSRGSQVNPFERHTRSPCLVCLMVTWHTQSLSILSCCKTAIFPINDVVGIPFSHKRDLAPSTKTLVIIPYLGAKHWGECPNFISAFYYFFQSFSYRTKHVLD